MKRERLRNEWEIKIEAGARVTRNTSKKFHLGRSILFIFWSCLNSTFISHHFCKMHTVVCYFTGCYCCGALFMNIFSYFIRCCLDWHAPHLTIALSRSIAPCVWEFHDAFAFLLHGCTTFFLLFSLAAVDISVHVLGARSEFFIATLARCELCKCFHNFLNEKTHDERERKKEK